MLSRGTASAKGNCAASGTETREAIERMVEKGQIRFVDD
jgi:hypothetical protein